MGAKAVDLLQDEVSKQMVGIIAKELVAVDLEEVLSKKREPDRSIWELAAILAI